MPSMQISVSDDLKAFIDEQAASPHYTSSSDFLRHILREDKRRVERRKQLEEKKDAFIALAREGFESPDSGLTPDELRARGPSPGSTISMNYLAGLWQGGGGH